MQEIAALCGDAFVPSVPIWNSQLGVSGQHFRTKYNTAVSSVVEQYLSTYPQAKMPESYIDVWWIPLNSLDWAAPPESILSPEERDRAARFRFEEHARRFRASHAALRLVLEQYVGRPANTIRLVTSPSGKPFIAGTTQIHFNLSHADDVALVAVSCDVEVGVDVEAIRLDFRIHEIAACFTDPELKILDQASSVEARAIVFFRLWTRKEAVLKANGSGLGVELRDIDVSHAPEDLVRVDRSRHQLWKVNDLVLAPGYAGALAAPPGDWQVRWRRLAVPHLRLSGVLGRART